MSLYNRKVFFQILALCEEWFSNIYCGVQTSLKLNNLKQSFIIAFHDSVG